MFFKKKWLYVLQLCALATAVPHYAAPSRPTLTAHVFLIKRIGGPANWS